MSRGRAFPKRLHVSTAKIQISLRIRTSDPCLRCPPEDSCDPLLHMECPAKTLIRLYEAQADLSFRCAHMQSCRKCCAPAQI